MRRWSTTSEMEVSCVSTIAALAETRSSWFTAPTCSVTLIWTLFPTCSTTPD